MPPIMNAQTTRMLQVVLSLAAARSAVPDLLDGSVEVYVGGASLVDTELFCNRCRELTMARCRLDAWLDFNAELKAKRLNCECGGVLTDRLSPIILLD